MYSAVMAAGPAAAALTSRAAAAAASRAARASSSSRAPHASVVSSSRHLHRYNDAAAGVFRGRRGVAAAAAAAGGAAVDKEAHNAEQAALRDEMVKGCTECTMPSESARATDLAAAALDGRTAAGRGEGATLRVLVIGAETGKLGAALLDAGASHVLTVDHSQAMLDRSSEAFDEMSTVG